MLKIFVFLLVMSVLKLLYDAFKFLRCFFKNERFETDRIDSTTRWASISYIITIIITGL